MNEPRRVHNKYKATRVVEIGNGVGLFVRDCGTYWTGTSLNVVY
jgi:hypothetical protein